MVELVLEFSGRGHGHVWSGRVPVPSLENMEESYAEAENDEESYAEADNDGRDIEGGLGTQQFRSALALNVQINEPPVNRTGQERRAAQWMLSIKLQESPEEGPEAVIRARHPIGAPSESLLALIKETKDEKWKYITCGLTLFALSITFFGLYFTHSHTLANFLTVMICLIVFYSIFGRLSYTVYQMISEEERLKSQGHPNDHQIVGRSVQLCLFFLVLFVSVIVFLLVAVNAISIFIGAHQTP